MASAEMAIAVKTRRYLNAFRHARAFSPESSISLHEHGLSRGMVFNRLLRKAIIKQAGAGRFYLDEMQIIRLKKRNNRTVIIGLIIFIIAVLLVFLHNTGRIRF